MRKQAGARGREPPTEEQRAEEERRRAQEERADVVVEQQCQCLGVGPLVQKRHLANGILTYLRVLPEDNLYTGGMFDLVSIPTLVG